MSATRRKVRGEKGATLVEMSIVGLLVLLVFLAIYEFGLLFRDNLSLTDAVSDATQIGAIVGPDVLPGGRTADHEIVSAVRDGLSSMNDSTVQFVVIFNAPGGGTPADEQVPLACKNGASVPGICNSYPAGEAFTAVENADYGYFVCPTPAVDKIACNWDPESRRDGPTSAQVETVGVYVKVLRNGYTGLFADTWTIERTSIARLEPGVTSP